MQSTRELCLGQHLVQLKEKNNNTKFKANANRIKWKTLFLSGSYQTRPQSNGECVLGLSYSLKVPMQLPKDWSLGVQGTQLLIDPHRYFFLLFKSWIWTI